MAFSPTSHAVMSGRRLSVVIDILPKPLQAMTSFE